MNKLLCLGISGQSNMWEPKLLLRTLMDVSYVVSGLSVMFKL